MNTTELIYLKQMHLLNSEAKLLQIVTHGENLAMILDRTVFYPQGGGQPCDRGFIQNDQFKFEVTDVRKDGQNVLHIGKIVSGQLPDLSASAHIPVQLKVDVARRFYHSKIHTAGHLIDNALCNLGHIFETVRAYHFPEGPYLEYILPKTNKLEDPAQIEAFRRQIEAEIARMQADDHRVEVLFINPSDLQKHCYEKSFKMPPVDEVRIIKVYGDLGCPCGGTHVDKISEIGPIKIPKIKFKSGNTKISYTVDQN